MPVAAVAAVLVLGGGIAAGALLSGPRGGKAASPSPSSSPTPTVAPVSRFRAFKSPFGVSLAWSRPAGSRVQAYLIYRDGILVTQIAAPAFGYSDGPLTPGRRYRYEIRAVSDDVRSDPVGLVVVTPKPPLEKARIEGAFDVHVKVESATGFSRYDPEYTLGWRFSPTCASGGCAMWKDLANDTLGGELSRNGKIYTGEDTGKLGTCAGVRATGTLTISFHVAKARGTQGQWQATKLVGTLETATESQLGCVSTHEVASFVATLA